MSTDRQRAHANSAARPFDRLTFSTPMGVSVAAVLIVAIIGAVLLFGPRGLFGLGVDPSPSPEPARPSSSSFVDARATPEATRPVTPAATPTPSARPSPVATAPPGSFAPGDTGAAGPGGDGMGAAGSPPSPPAPPEFWTGVRLTDPPVTYGRWGPGSFRITDVHFWNDRYVASGTDDGVEGREAIFLVSNDGEHWDVTDEQASHGAVPSCVVGTSDRLLAVSLQGGPAAGLWSSIDGFDWQAVDSPTWANAWSDGTPRAVADGPAGYVAVGVSGSGPDKKAVVARSTDGRAWTLIDQPDVFQDASPHDVAAFPGGYAIAGTSADPSSQEGAAIAVWISSDGSAWRRAGVEQTPAETGTIRLLVGKDGLALMSSEPDSWLGTVHVTVTLASVDGSIWRPVDEPWSRLTEPLAFGDNPPVRAKTFAADGTRMVVLGLSPEAMPLAWVSTGGTTWDELSVLSGGSELYDTWPPIPESLAIAPGGFVLWETLQCDPGVWCGMSFAAGTAVGD